MILHNLTDLSEDHPVYKNLSLDNAHRQYTFLQSIVEASLGIGRPLLSQTIIKAMNYHAIACLHISAGEYRPCQVVVNDLRQIEKRETYEPPPYYLVDSLMDDFVNQVNRQWKEIDAITLSAYVLWRLNYIHPFVNGNGRTARAMCFYTLCIRHGAWLGNVVTLPQLLQDNKDAYISALKEVDKNLNLAPLVRLLTDLLTESIGGKQ